MLGLREGMDELETRIARTLAKRALKGGLTTYPILADTVGWYNRTGQGLGRPLASVLEFCDKNNLPILTSIVCATGTNSPSRRGIMAMHEVLGRQINIKEEQEAVRRFDWLRVTDLGLEEERHRPHFGRLYATAVERFEPENQGFFCFSDPQERAECLKEMGTRSCFVVHVSEILKTTNVDAGRLLGLTELSPVTSDELLPTDPSRLTKPSYGLRIKRAWRFLKPPLAISTLTETWTEIGKVSASTLTELSTGEVAEVLQYDLSEVAVDGQAKIVLPFTPPEPSIHTYMVVCRDELALKAVKAQTGDLLVKIGVSNDKERRLQELNGNHIAVMVGISFRPFSHGTWESQHEALEIERRAHEWSHVNGRHASGEYFFLKEQQLAHVGAIVFKA